MGIITRLPEDERNYLDLIKKNYNSEQSRFKYINNIKLYKII
jgi:hypothetical protein